MDLNFEKPVINNENVSHQDLYNNSLTETDLEETPITFKDLFIDHMATTRYRNNISNDEIAEDFVLDINVDCTDIDKIWNFDINSSIQSDNNNLLDFELIKPKTRSDSEEIEIDSACIDVNELPKPKKKLKATKRQSTRIENLTRKKIAEQIQRENVRLAMEAQLLTNSEIVNVQENSVFYINGKPASLDTQKYMSLPTDLDAEEEAELEALYKSETKIDNDDDHNKICCSCHKPKGDSSIIVCGQCERLYHFNCVDVTKIDGFTCQLCVKSPISPDVDKSPTETVTTSDDVKEAPKECETITDEVCVVDDDDCLITMAEKPLKFTSNIFQLISTSEQADDNVIISEPPPVTNPPVATPTELTSPCLHRGCEKLVDRNKSLYCSKNCIDAYSKMIIENNQREKAKEYGLPKGPKLAKMTRFVLAQPTTDTVLDEYTAPTEDNLSEFLEKNPTYKVYQSTKPDKVKPTTEKVDKYPDVSNNDPTKHIKMVTHFATLFKKSMPLAKFNTEFNNIWHYCTQIEEEVSKLCNHIIDDQYVARVKELSDYLRNDDKHKLCSYILHNKLSVSDLLSTTKEELEERSKIVTSDHHTTATKEDTVKNTVLNDQGSVVPVMVKPNIDNTASTKDEQLKIITTEEKVKVVEKKKIVVSKQGLSLFSDTTHLHGQHLYDMKCKVCNGAQKIEAANAAKNKTPPPSLIDLDSSHTHDRENINPQINKDNKSIVSGAIKTSDTVLVVEQPRKCDPPIKPTNTNNGIREMPLAYSRTYSSKLPLGQLVSIWEGKISYEEVGSIRCQSYLVTRYLFDKHNDKDRPFLVYSDDEMRYKLDVTASIGRHLKITGRSKLSEVEDYLEKLRRRSDKEFIVLQLAQKNTNNDKVQYKSLFNYLFSRTRCGRVNTGNNEVKDCFIYPLNGSAIIPNIFIPFIGPGLALQRDNLLLIIIVRTLMVKLPYKPISQDNEFGPDLDECYLSNVTLPSGSSPIVASNDVLSWVINVRPDASIERDNSLVDNNTSNNNVGNCYDDSSLSNTSESLKEITPTNERDLATISPQSDVTITSNSRNLSAHITRSPARKRRIHDSRHTRILSDTVSNTTSESKITTSIFLQRFADIVMNGPTIKDNHCKALSQTVADIISKNDTFDVTIFQQMADIVIKVRENEAQDSSQPFDHNNVKSNPCNEANEAIKPSTESPQRLVNFSWDKIDSEVHNRFNSLWDKMDPETQNQLNSSLDKIDPDCEYEISSRKKDNYDMDDGKYGFSSSTNQNHMNLNGQYRLNSSSDKVCLAERYQFKSVKQECGPGKVALAERYRFNAPVIPRCDLKEVDQYRFSSHSTMKEELIDAVNEEEEVREKSMAQSMSMSMSVSPKSDSLEEMVMTESRNLYLKRKHSTRLYTYYDSFVNDDNSEEKRQKYFFSPHCEWASPEIVPLHCHSRHRRTSNNSHCRQLLPPFRDCDPTLSDGNNKPLSVFAIIRDTLK